MPNPKFLFNEPKDNYGSNSGSGSGSGGSGFVSTLLDSLNNTGSDSGVSSSSDEYRHTIDPFTPAGSVPGMSGKVLSDLFFKMFDIAGDDSDARMSVLQAYLQYLIGEQDYSRNYNYAETNYQRSTAPNQVSLMQSAGMSRAAALAALSSGSTPQSVTSQNNVNPNPTSIEQNRNDRLQTYTDIVMSSAELANEFATLAQSPFDFAAKKVTSQLLKYQSQMLGTQIQGMQDAAMFLQAVANADSGSDEERKLAKLSVNDQYAYFNEMAGKAFDFSKHKASSWQYAQSDSFRRAASNPFFWATLNEQVKARNDASASAFFPEMAERQNASLRAAVQLTQNQAENEKIRGRILGVQAFKDETLRLAETQLQQLQIECARSGLKFDKARADAFLTKIKEFNDLDFLNLDYQISRISAMKDAELYQKEVQAMSETYDYNAAMFYYMSSLYSLKHGVLQQMYDVGNDGVSIYGNDELNKWIKSYLQYNELGNITEKSFTLESIKTGINGLFTGAAAIFGGAKLWQSAKAARAAAAGYSFSSSASGLTGSTTISPLGIPLLFLGLQGDTNSTYTRIMQQSSQGEIGLPMN